MNLYLLSFNNYYNREVKKFDSIYDYDDYLLDIIDKNVNFNPGDGVDTKHIVNYKGDIQPDYLMVVDGEDIISRWFIIDSHFIRKYQYELVLKRDVIADNYEAVIGAPCFIEKATLDNDNPLIFNNENMGFNQIKTKETLLKDKSGCPWIVGYMARTDGTSNVSMSGKVKVVSGIDFDLTQYDNFNDWEYAYLFNRTEPLDDGDNMEYLIDWVQPNAPTDEGQIDIELKTGSVYYSHYSDKPGKGFVVKGTGSLNETAMTAAIKKYLPNLQTWARIEMGIDTQELLTTAKNLIGKIVKTKDEDGRDVFYRITAYNIKHKDWDMPIDPARDELVEYTTAMCNEAGLEAKFDTENRPVIAFRTSRFYLTFTGVDNCQLSYNIPENRVHCGDAPYDLFCMPYGDNLIFQNVSDRGYNDMRPSKSLMLSLAQQIAEQNGSKIYDLQLVPYCPFSEYIVKDNIIDLGSCMSDKSVHRAVQYSVITTARLDQPEPGAEKVEVDKMGIGVIFFPMKSSFTNDIELPEPIVITNPKIENECDKYRIVSPNYNGSFEFSAAKNGGISKFNIDCTYLPHNPYIHVNPDFKGLYGKDFNDVRGLICRGDFSLSRMTDAWVNYQLQNKNYNESFKRETEFLDKRNSMQTVSDSLSAAGGAVSGALMGAGAGLMVGGPVGAIVGGVAGGVLSAGAGVADTVLNAQMREEEMKLRKDQFGYQLGNIQALPDSIAKTTAYNENNKYFPVLEYYTCTEVEKQALKDKIKYNGMTVMAIGKIADYIKSEPTYIKGQLIKLKDIQEDYHAVMTIAEEINKGMFI